MVFEPTVIINAECKKCPEKWVAYKGKVTHLPNTLVCPKCGFESKTKNLTIVKK